MSWAEFGKHYTGVLLELTPGEGFRPANQRSRLRLSDLWGKLVGVKRSAVQIGSLSLVMQLFVVASPLFLQVVVDEVLSTGRGDMLVGVAAGFLGLVLINAASQALRGYVLARTGGVLSLQVARNLFGHLLRLPVSYFERRSLGGIESRFYSIEPIQRALTEGVTSSVVDGLFAVVSVVCMLLYSVALTGVALASVTAYVLIRLLTYSRNRALQEASIVSMADRRTFFAETLRGATALKLLGAEESREATWLRKSTKAVNDMIRLRVLRIGFDGAVAVVFGLEFVVLVAVAATSVQAGAMTTGMMFAFLAFRTNFGDRSVALIEQLFEFRMLRLHLDRMADVALERPENHMPDTNPSAVQGRVECRDVAFRYGDEGPLVLEDVSFSVEPGESVAIVGPSGSGKTTLLKLMLGLLEPSAGGVLVDGEPLDRTTVRHFRRHVGVVMQHDQLFGGTIGENIATRRGGRR